MSGERILVVDDEVSLGQFLEIMLNQEGYDTTVVTGGQAAVDMIENAGEFDLVMTDLKMPRVGGMDVLEAVKERFPHTEVLIMTAFATADTAIEAMKKGAYDYIQKPFKVDEIRVVVERGLASRRLVRENLLLKQQVTKRYSFHNLIGRSPAMQEVFNVIERVADTRTNVLITGESGTGKELIARAIHHNSRRKTQRMVTVNCGAIPENLIESELFGHVKGAFTGATSHKKGMFQAADGGTLFLDEIAELPMHLQVKLLRALQERFIRPVGSNHEVAVDVRVVAATNQNLETAIAEGRMREDLYYRLKVIELRIPPLRQRLEDVPPIARHFLARYAKEMGRAIADFQPRALEALLRHRFPGNVRELENIVERAVTFENSSMVTLDSLPPNVVAGRSTLVDGGLLDTLPPEGVDLEGVLQEVERRLLKQALVRTDGNRTEAAKLLQISFRAMRYKLDKYKLGDDEHDSD